jgi:SNF2 family DNA or RNA helicase
MLKVDYHDSSRRAVFTWDATDADKAWPQVLQRTVLDLGEDARLEGGFGISLPWWSFVSLRNHVHSILSAYGLELGRNLQIGDSAAHLLRQSRRVVEDYYQSYGSSCVSTTDIMPKLRARGFRRNLSPEQLRNVLKMSEKQSAATFSVPGAGKTTEALSFFFLKSDEPDHLLVVAPKNAFPAWDEQLRECFPNIDSTFTRLRLGPRHIEKLLRESPKFMIVTYQQLALSLGVIADYCSKKNVYIFLDESHRIKSGKVSQTGKAALDLAHLAKGKLIMSGTPMPQSTADLVPQFSFLYPEIPTDPDTVVDMIKSVYVRTTKSELGLPPIERKLVKLPITGYHAELYGLMRSEVARDARKTLDTRNKQALRSLGRSVTRLIQFVSNPALLALEVGSAYSSLLGKALAEDEGVKLQYVLKRARKLANLGQKVLIWSSFVKNVEYISTQLSDVGAVFIHGAVDAGADDDDDTREGRVRLFHDDPDTRVLVANPAAASEGISLHKVCHHAVYLDRTFNAAHYLQSEDRIHRLGMAPGQRTTVEIVECEGTIDETVRTRLGYKINRMAEVLNDHSLSPAPTPASEAEMDDPELSVLGLSIRDIEALAARAEQ